MKVVIPYRPRFPQKFTSNWRHIDSVYWLLTDA